MDGVRLTKTHTGCYDRKQNDKENGMAVEKFEHIVYSNFSCNFQ